MKKIYIILVALMAVFTVNAQELASKADNAYSAENYDEAIALYKEAIAQDGASSDMWYNLGNAYYRADSLARAIISYERALMLDPTNEDARTNLAFVNSKIIDVPSDTSSYSTIFIEKTMETMTANGWAVTSVIVFLILLGLTAGYIFSDNVRLRKVCFFSGIVMLFATVICIVITVTVTSRMTTHDQAVITSPSARLSTSPSTPVNNSQQAFLLHEGTKVTVLDSVATPLDPVTKMWYEVKVDNEHRAWIDKEDIEVI